MNLKTGLVGMMATTALATAAFGQVYTAAGVPAAIADNSLTTVDVVVAGGPGIINQLNVLLDITHTYDADLDIVLVAPDSRYVTLSTDNGGAAENFSYTRFTTCGSGSITAGVVPFSGNFIPEGGEAVASGWSGPALSGAFLGSLAAFNGSNSNGTWQLWVYDDAGFDQGTVNYVSLEFNGSLDPFGPTAPSGSNPSGTGVANPLVGLPGATSLLTVAVSPGGCPLSTGLTVVADLSLVGGSATQALVDNGTNGDAVAGDSVYSYSLTTSGSQGGGNFSFPVSISDAQARTGAATINYRVTAIPSVFTDLGDHGTTSAQITRDVSLASPTGIQWYRVVLPPVSAAGFVDIWTVQGGANAMTDTEIGVYDNSGGLISSDDDSGVGNMTVLTFGMGSGQSLGDNIDLGGDGLANGEDGALNGGTCWVAVGRYPVAFNQGFDVVSTYAGTQTDTTLNLSIAPASAPFPPTITAVAVNPNPALAGADALFTATINPGGNPASTSLAGRVDLSAIGGSATQLMYDDGSHGDAAGGDGTFSCTFAIPASTAEANYTVTYTASDAQSRTSNRNLAFNVNTAAQWEESISAPGGDAGDLPNTAATPEGSGPLTSIGGTLAAGEADMYMIEICEPANFSASTVNDYTNVDTELFLFDANGTGIAMNDDEDAGFSLQSTLTSLYTASLATGNYLVTVSQFDTDPTNSLGAAIWEDQPYGVERAPDGLGNGGDLVVTGWEAGLGGGGAYRLNLTGSCFAGASNNCVADVDDGTGSGTQDGAVTIDDLLYFLLRFELGC